MTELDQSNESGIVVVSEIFPENLYVLPINDRPVLPGMVAPLVFAGEEYVLFFRKLIEYKDQNKYFGVVYAKKIETENGWIDDYKNIGSIVRVYKLMPVDETTVQVVGQAIQRFQKKEILNTDTPQLWKVEYPIISEKKDEELKAYSMAIISTAKEMIKMNAVFQEQLKMLFSQIRFENPGLMMDLIASTLSIEPEKLQIILETFDLHQRAQILLQYLKEELEVIQLQEKIKKQIDEKISSQQKEFFLREQLKAIKKELGLEKDTKSTDLEKIEARLKEIQLSEEAQRVVEQELAKLREMETSSPEYNVIRNYVSTIVELPWGIFSKEQRDIQKAKEILNKEHYGLEDVKSRILEFIATIIKKGSLSGSNILLVGPPGVGKTSIGKSIANALGRKFFRFSVGGMRDEAEIKGHRRTYVGAIPGKLIESLRRVSVANPVIMLDELDKIGRNYQGDPASALLEVLDPEQNSNFLDHYIDVRFDLSNVLFIATANQIDTIPLPLLDRMEKIQLSGYILEEKREIAKQYLIPNQLEKHGLKPEEVLFTDEAITQIIDGYAREAGVRNLENQIKKVLRKVVLQMVEQKLTKAEITLENLEEFLGKPIFTKEELYNKDIPGVALGLAYTSLGGATLYVEATSSPGKGGFLQTGQLGDVMKESSQIAYSYIKSLTSHLEEKSNYFEENSIHLHVPAGATPKDGPSAGITMALALYSLVTNKPIRGNLAMTGELTLTGKVLAIGGVKEKTIAAKRVGIKELILPVENKKDFEELPNYIKEGIEVHYVNYFSDVLKVAYN